MGVKQMTKSANKTGESSKKNGRRDSVEKTSYIQMAEFVDNLLELGKLQATFLNHLRKNLQSIKAN